MKLTFRTTLAALIISSALSSAYAASVPAGAQLASSQEIVRHIKDEPASLDPLKAVGLPEIQVLRDLFEGLTNQDAQGKIVPGVAQSWSSNDNKTWLFTLRKDARWSSGEPVTAQDFVYSWQRLVDPKNSSPFAWFAALSGIENAEAITKGQMSPDKLGVVATDETHLKVTLSRPLPWFPSMVANVAMFPVPQKVIAQNGDGWTAPGKLVGNGAYQLQERVVNEKIVLVRNPHYWDNAHSVLTKVTFIPINEESSATKRYRAGDIDITESFPKNMYGLLKKSCRGRCIRRISLAPTTTRLIPRKGRRRMCGCVRRCHGALTAALSRKKCWAPARNRPGTSHRTSLPASRRSRAICSSTASRN